MASSALPCHEVHVLQPGRADESVVAELADGEEEALTLPPLLVHVLEPALRLLHAHRRLVAGWAADLGVVDAGHVGGHVALLEGAQPDPFAAQQRALGDRAGGRWLASGSLMRLRALLDCSRSSHSTPFRVRGWMKATAPWRPRRGSRSISSASAAASASRSAGRSSLTRQTWCTPSPRAARKRATPLSGSIGSTSSIRASAAGPGGKEAEPDALARED